MGYYQALVDYLQHGEEKDKRVEKHTKLLEIEGKPDEEGLCELLEDRNIVQTLNPKRVYDFDVAQNLKKNRKDPQWDNKVSQALINLALERANDRLGNFFEEIDKEEFAKFLLHNSKYDIAGLEEAKSIFWPELVKWAGDNDYYIPVREFFDNKDHHFREGNHRGDYKDFFKEYTPMNQGLEGLAKILLLPMVLLDQALQQTKFYEWMDKMVEKLGSQVNITKTDFNRYSDFMKDRSSEVGDMFKDFFERLSKSYKERHVIAWIDEDSNPFYVQHVINGFPNKNADDIFLVKSYNAVNPVDGIEKKGIVAKVSQSKYHYKKKYKPSRLEDVLVPFDGEYIGSEANVLCFGFSPWDLDKLPQKSVAKLDLPEEFLERIEGYKRRNTSPEIIARNLREEFYYESPKKILGKTRFESAAITQRGVCQDVNFLYWYTLREMGIPSHYILGHVPEGDTLTTTEHASVLVKMGDNWNILDATPHKIAEKESSKTSSFNFSIPSFPKMDTHRIRDLIESIGDSYISVKEAARNKGMELQQRMYKDLLDEFRESASKTTSIIKEQLSVRDFLPDFYREVLQETRQNLYHMDQTIDKINFFTNLPEDVTQNPKINIHGFFKPKQIRESLEEMEYYQNAYPEYAQRLDMFKVSRDILEKTMGTEGNLRPFHSGQNGSWENIINYMFLLAGQSERPSTPLDIPNPKRTFYRTVKQLLGQDSITGETYVIKKPKHIQPKRSNDKRMFHSVNEVPSEEEIRRVYPLGFEEHAWLKKEFETIDLRPSKEHYTHSPAILTFDKEYSQKYRDYWNFVGNYLRGHIHAGEMTASVVAEELTKARADFKGGSSPENLDSKYIIFEPPIINI